MEQGHWFLSLYNDDGDPQEISFIAAVAEDMTHNCPNGCSGKGECLMGHCQCQPGFGGDDCNESKSTKEVNFNQKQLYGNINVILFQVFVQYYAVNEANILMENVNAILAGRAKSVPCDTMNAKYPTVMVMATA